MFSAKIAYRSNYKEQRLTKYVRLDDSFKGKYDEVISYGCILSVEIFSTENIAIKIDKPNTGIFDIIITRLASELVSSFEKLLDRFDRQSFDKRIANKVEQEIKGLKPSS